MKLNNKGFAITGILYGLLILFALLVASYLTILTAKKNRLDGIISDIEEEYYGIAGEENTLYTLTLTKGTGVSKIYYKTNNDSNYILASDDVEVNIKNNTVYYYYGIASIGYTMSSCTSSNPCSGTIEGSQATITLTASTNSYILTLNKGTGLSKIYYKLSSDSTWTSTSSSIEIKNILYGKTYNYFATVNSGYIISNCTSPTNYCNITISNNKEINLSATKSPNTNYNVVIYVRGSEETSGSSNKDTFTSDVYIGANSANVSCENGAYGELSGLGGGNATITVTNITTDTSCSITV